MKRDERPAHAWAAETGPGLATLSVDNDPRGILSYSFASEQFGFEHPLLGLNGGTGRAITALRRRLRAAPAVHR